MASSHSQPAPVPGVGDAERLALALYRAVQEAKTCQCCTHPPATETLSRVEALLRVGADPNHPLDVFGRFPSRDGDRPAWRSVDENELHPDPAMHFEDEIEELGRCYAAEMVADGVALVEAAANRNLAVIKLLLKHGATASTTALAEALIGCGDDLVMVHTLLEAGADPAGYVGALQPLQIFVRGSWDEEDEGGSGVAAKLLLCAGAPPTVCEYMGYCQANGMQDNPIPELVCILDAAKADAATRRATWLGGGLRRWKDRGGWHILLSRLCAQDRAVLVPGAPAAARCFAQAATMPAEIRDRILGLCGFREQLDLLDAIDVWFHRDCGVDITADELDDNIGDWAQGQEDGAGVAAGMHTGKGRSGCSECARHAHGGY